MTDMPDRFIRAMLRGATSAKILRGWQGPHTDERSYQLSPANGHAAEQPLAYVIGYVESLQLAGIEPLYVAHDRA